MQKSVTLGTEPLAKLLVRLSLPAIAAQIVNMLYNIVDRVYIGHIPEIGSFALTGVGVCLPLFMLVASFAALVSSGGAPRASIFMGRQDYDSAEKTLGSCFSMQIFVSIVFSVVLILFGKNFLLAFGASENTIIYAYPYLRIYALGTIFVQLTLGMNAFITAQGFAVTSMLTVLVGAVCNIVLDPILIFALGMGVRGAALATVISQAVSTVWVLHFLTGKKTYLRIKAKNIMPRAEYALPCLALGFAPFLMQASESFIIICFNSSLLKYGGDMAVGAMTICSSVMNFTYLPMQGLGQGAQPIISYNFGAKNVERVKGVFKLLLRTLFCICAIVCVSSLMFPKLFAMVFTSDIELITYTAPMLRRYMCAIILMSIQMACQFTFVAIGNAKASAAVAIMRKFILLFPFIYIMPRIFTSDKVAAIFLAEPCADVLSVTFCSVLFAFQFSKAIKKMQSM